MDDYVDDDDDDKEHYGFSIEDIDGIACLDQYLEDELLNLTDSDALDYENDLTIHVKSYMSIEHDVQDDDMTDLLRYTCDFIDASVLCINQIPDDAEEAFAPTAVLSNPSINNVIDYNEFLDGNENIGTEQLLSGSDNLEVNQLMEMMLNAVECCAPIFSSRNKIIKILPLISENQTLHIIEDEEIDINQSLLSYEEMENSWKRQIHIDSSSELEKSLSLMKEQEISQASLLQIELDAEVKAALEDDRRQRKERRERREREAALFQLQNQMIVSSMHHFSISITFYVYSYLTCSDAFSAAFDCGMRSEL